MFIDCLAEGAPVVLADMGAGSGQVALNWFETMYPDLAEQGILFHRDRCSHFRPGESGKRIELGSVPAEPRGVRDCGECHESAGRLLLLARQRPMHPFSRGISAARAVDGIPTGGS
jgi:hypothetical protein